jgi:hypothetical protein
MRTSPSGLIRMAKLLKRLREEKVIDKAEERAAFDFFFVNFILHRLGGDPKDVDKAADLLNNEKFHQLLSQLGPTLKEEKKDSGTRSKGPKEK